MVVEIHMLFPLSLHLSQVDILNQSFSVFVLAKIAFYVHIELDLMSTDWAALTTTKRILVTGNKY